MTSSEFVDAVPPPALNEGLLITNPWVWITALLLGVLILWLGWHFGAVRREEELLDDRKKVVDTIWERINEKARAAAAAPRNKVTSAAHDLMEEIENLIGSVVVLTPFGRRATALRHALDGKPVTRVRDEPEVHGDDHGGKDDAKDGDGAPHPATALSPSALASQINIAIHGPAAADKPGRDDGPPRDAVRDAVIDICDYWSRATMKAELHAAQKALLRMPPPKPKLSGAGKAH